ncbi:MAG: ABC transporter permease [bacterium]
MDAVTIFLRELAVFKRTIIKFMSSNLVSPLLYLTAFGWGLGHGMKMGGVTYLEFIIPGIVSLTSMGASFNGIATNLNISRIYFKTYEEVQIAPVHPLSVALGYIFTGAFRGLLASFLVLVVSFFFKVKLHLNLWFFLALFLTCFIFSGLGVFAAMIIETHEDLSNFSRFVIMPMTFLCGTFFTTDNLPSGVNAIIRILPLTHSSKLMRMSILKGEYSLFSFGVLMTYALIFFILAVVSIKKKGS